MTTTQQTRTTPRKAGTTPEPRLGWLDRRLRRAVLDRLSKLECGRLVVWETWTREPLEFAGAKPGPSAEIDISDPRFYRQLAFGGGLGAGTAYRDGLWSSADPAAVVRLMIRNRSVLDGFDRGFARFLKPLLSVAHRLNRNTRSGSKKNITAHYDLGNDFFGHVLDSTMTYSSGLFEDAGTTLRESQIAKLDRLCRRLRLGPGDSVLEIGSGWGSFAIHAASRYGCRVTSITISPSQLAVARQRAIDAGVEDRVQFLECDYRDLEGQFDRVVSIEMIEAVGADFLETYLARIDHLLKPDGLVGIQAITIQDQHYEAALRRVDFIKRYIFPGSFIPSVTAILNATTKATDLRMVHLEDFGPHYAETLRRWRRNLFVRREEIRDLGYSEEFLRCWDYYLCYCEGGFAERYLGVSQLILAAPNYRGPSPLSVSAS